MKAARETVGWLVKDKGDRSMPYYGSDLDWQPTREEADVFETYRAARYRRSELLRGERRSGSDFGPLSIVRITKRAR